MQLYAVNFISLLSELSREIKFTAYSGPVKVDFDLKVYFQK